MTNKMAMRYLSPVKSLMKKLDFDRHYIEALDLAIKALERDSKVDDITLHWNEEKSTFVAACNAFEEILKVYGRGVEADKAESEGEK